MVFNISDNLCATICGANFMKMYFDSYEPLYLGRSRSLEWLTEASDGRNVATIIFSSSQKTKTLTFVNHSYYSRPEKCDI